MFFRASECILEDHPDLTRDVEALDAFLREHQPGPFEAARIGEIIDVATGVVARLLELYATMDVLVAAESALCPQCKTIMQLPTTEPQESVSIGSVYCDICGEDIELSALRPAPLQYRLAADVELTSKRPQAEDGRQPPQMYVTAEEFPKGFLDDPFRNAPVLSYLTRKLSETTRPLAGFQAVVVLHFLKDLVPFTQALMELGLDPRLAHFFYKDYPYPQRTAVARWLSDQGIRVFGLGSLEKELSVLDSETSDRQAIVIEDGGYIVPRLHDTYGRLLKRTVGAVEQTTKGKREDEQASEKHGSLKIPVMSVADARIKLEFEPPHVADAALRNIRSLIPEIPLSGLRVTVLGYGAIGRRVTEKLKTDGAIVTVYDADDARHLVANQAGCIVTGTPREAVASAKLVIGCTGRRSLGRTELLNLPHGSMLVSASSDQVEFPIDELTALSRSSQPFLTEAGVVGGTLYHLRARDRDVILLANGYPVNFWGMNSMPDRASDLIMALILVSTCRLATGPRPPAGISQSDVDLLAEEHELAKLYSEHGT